MVRPRRGARPRCSAFGSGALTEGAATRAEWAARHRDARNRHVPRQRWRPAVGLLVRRARHLDDHHPAVIAGALRDVAGEVGGAAHPDDVPGRGLRGVWDATATADGRTLLPRSSTVGRQIGRVATLDIPRPPTRVAGDLHARRCSTRLPTRPSAGRTAATATGRRAQCWIHFSGTGTTLAVADLHGRDAIGIDLDARNREQRTPARGMRPRLCSGCAHRWPWASQGAVREPGPPPVRGAARTAPTPPTHIIDHTATGPSLTLRHQGPGCPSSGRRTSSPRRRLRDDRVRRTAPSDRRDLAETRTER